MLAGGTGRLIRRPSVVLFDPTGSNTEVATRFDAADTDSEAVAELKKHLIDSGFNAGPLVVVQWARADFDLLVFGDVEVHTSAIAAPMVSGAGSATWIERHLGAIELGSATNVELWSGEAADPSTNLGLGIVACAGFRISLDFAAFGADASNDAASDVDHSRGAGPASAASTSNDAASNGAASNGAASDGAGSAPVTAHSGRRGPTVEVPSAKESSLDAAASSTVEVEAPEAAAVETAPDPVSAAVVDDATEWVDTNDSDKGAAPPASPLAPDLFVADQSSSSVQPATESRADAPAPPLPPAAPFIDPSTGPAAVSSPVDPADAPVMPSGSPAPPPPPLPQDAAIESPSMPSGPVDVAATEAPSSGHAIVEESSSMGPAAPAPSGPDADQDPDPFTSTDDPRRAASGVGAAAAQMAVDHDPPTQPGPAGEAVDPFESSSVESASDASGSGDSALVEAALCSAGHPNPPRSASCYTCGLNLIEDQSLELIEQPVVGRIMFSGGQGLSLVKPVAMGRKPDSGNGQMHPVVIDHIEVSRSHASIAVDGWTVLLTDQSSRNGTWVTPANDSIPVRLEPNVPHVLEHGTTVHLGGPEVSFTYLFDGVAE